MQKPNFYRLACATVLIALGLILSAGNVFAQAQGSSGQITGIVRDNQGRPLPAPR
ncbi:MAG: hypothetical protein IPJ07_23695 [Acidobacteria bacterium]|nr:hypothetical protein [Acidobacteriota bacterium]